MSAYRPGPLRWLRYSFGGRLPPTYAEWVRHDLTDADWRLRELLRAVVQLAIPLAVLLSVPLELSIKLPAALLLTLSWLFICLAYGDELRDRRLRQHHLPPVGR